MFSVSIRFTVSVQFFNKILMYSVSIRFKPDPYVFHLQLSDGFLDIVEVADLCHWCGSYPRLLSQIYDSGSVLGNKLLQHLHVTHNIAKFVHTVIHAENNDSITYFIFLLIQTNQNILAIRKSKQEALLT